MTGLELSLAGKVSLVTGAAGGLGECIAANFARAGSMVFLTDFNEPGLARVRTDLENSGYRVDAYAIDLTSPGGPERLVALVEDRFGRIDVLVNSAGINRPERAEQVTEKNWDKVFAVNLKAMFFLCQAAGKRMMHTGGGSIVNVSSQAGIVALPLRAAYCSSKGGVNQLTRTLAYEWAKHGITVNAVAPTFVRTPFTAKMFEDKDFERYVIDNIPLGRMAEPEDVAYAALFLASGHARMITGHILSVDGGWTIK